MLMMLGANRPKPLPKPLPTPLFCDIVADFTFASLCCLVFIVLGSHLLQKCWPTGFFLGGWQIFIYFYSRKQFITY